MTPKRIEVIERQNRALQLRKGGASFDQIAKQLGYGDRSAASRAVRAALRALPAENAEDVRSLETERLDQLLLAMWPKAMTGNGWAVDRCLKIMERRSFLLGLDAPKVTKVEVVTEDTIDAKIKQLEQELERMPPPRAAIEAGPPGMGEGADEDVEDAVVVDLDD